MGLVLFTSTPTQLDYPLAHTHPSLPSHGLCNRKNNSKRMSCSTFANIQIPLSLFPTSCPSLYPIPQVKWIWSHMTTVPSRGVFCKLQLVPSGVCQIAFSKDDKKSYLPTPPTPLPRHPHPPVLFLQHDFVTGYIKRGSLYFLFSDGATLGLWRKWCCVTSKARVPSPWFSALELWATCM